MALRYTDTSSTSTLTARLHPDRRGYRCSVLFRGKLIVSCSRDAECDVARALLTHGIVGELTMLDDKTGRHRSIIDVEKAARLTAAEGPYDPHFALSP